MGTSNFGKVETSVIYAIDADDEFIWEDTRENIGDELETINKDPKIDWEFYSEDTMKTSCNSSTSIGNFYAYVPDTDPPVSVDFLVKTVGGYYSGFCLDFEMRLTCKGESEDYDEADRIFDDMMYEDSENIQEKDRDAFVKKVETKIEEGKNLLEKVYGNYTDRYRVAARFGNGETIYELIEE